MMTKRLVSVLAAVALAASSAPAQRREVSREELEQRHARVLAAPFVRNAAWVTDYGEARAAAKRSGVLIFAYFTRSYAP